MNFLKVSDFPKVTQLEALELGIDTGVLTSTLLRLHMALHKTGEEVVPRPQQRVLQSGSVEK